MYSDRLQESDKTIDPLRLDQCLHRKVGWMHGDSKQSSSRKKSGNLNDTGIYSYFIGL